MQVTLVSHEIPPSYQMLKVLSLIVFTCELAKFSLAPLKMQVPLREITHSGPTTIPFPQKQGEGGCSDSGREGTGPRIRGGHKERKTRMSDRLDYHHKVLRASSSQKAPLKTSMFI